MADSRANEALDLGGAITSLVASGLPIEQGLKAAAQELPRGRTAKALTTLAEKLEQGQQLDAALAANDRILPEHLRALVVAGLRSASLGRVLEEFVAAERHAADVHRRIVLALSYPALLLLLMSGLFALFCMGVIPGLAELYDDFDDILPAQTAALRELAVARYWLFVGNFVSLLVVFVFFWTAMNVAEMRALLVPVPILGRVIRWAGLARFSRLLALAVDIDVPAPQALVLAAGGCQDATIKREARMAAARAETGSDLADSLAAIPSFPASVSPILRWGQHSATRRSCGAPLADSLRTAADIFEGRSEAQFALLSATFSPLALLFVAWGALFLLASTIVPMVELYEKLRWARSPSDITLLTRSLGSVSVASAQSFPGLLLVGIASLASLSLFYRDRRPGEDALHLIMTVIGRVMIIVACVEVSLLFLNVLFAVLAVLFVGILEYGAYRYWLRRRVSLLAVMACAARRWMPLAPAVEAFSHEWSGLFGRRCRRLAELLHAGASVSEALRQSGRLLPARALALIEAGERSGNVVGGLNEALRRPADEQVISKIWSSLAYVGLLLLAGGAMFVVCSSAIATPFRRILVDFDVDLPGPTALLMDISDWFAEYGWQQLLAALLALGFMVMVIRRDMLAWLPPPLRTLARRKQAAIVVRCLALAADVSRPFGPVLSSLAETHPSLAMRVRVGAAADQISVGYGWAECLERQGLLRRAELALIQSAQRVDNLPWALREVADGIERRLALQLKRWLEIVMPVVVVAAGVVVVSVIASLLLPLIGLIEASV